VVSEVDSTEVTNAIDQANREIGNRFDFKGSDARVEHAEYVLTIHAEDDFKVSQARDILTSKLSKRKVDLACLELGEVVESGVGKARQEVKIRHGIDQESAKKLVKEIKASKLKVQAAIQGEQLRITGKKRDDLQDAIAMLKKSKIGLPLQYTNFRD